MKVAFIGFGNMAQAITRAWLGAQVLAPEDIYACARRYERLEQNCQRLGVQPCKTPAEAAAAAEVVVIAVKPYQIADVCGPIVDLLKTKTVISLAAGMPYEKLKTILPGVPVISAIPNTPISVGAGILVCEEENSLSQDQKALVVRLFEPVALIVGVDSAHLSIAGTIGGCSPAFAALFIEALADAGVKYGLTRQLSYELSAKVLEGTGKLFLKEGGHPGQLKDAVCSPGGTTIKGVCALEHDGFRGDIIGAIEAIEDASKA